jgi:hypothetical protein
MLQQCFPTTLGHVGFPAPRKKGPIDTHTHRQTCNVHRVPFTHFRSWRASKKDTRCKKYIRWRSKNKGIGTRQRRKKWQETGRGLQLDTECNLSQTRNARERAMNSIESRENNNYIPHSWFSSTAPGRWRRRPLLENRTNVAQRKVESMNTIQKYQLADRQELFYTSSLQH